jgi:hypothetical protein
MRWPIFAAWFLLATGCRSSQPQPSIAAPQTSAASATARPTTPDACRACNGDWGPHGLAQKEGCVCRTKDAGKSCKSKGDCESQCVASDPPNAVILEKGLPPKGFFLGHCHEFVRFFGCGRLLRDRSSTPEPLDEPPAKICID